MKAQQHMWTLTVTGKDGVKKFSTERNKVLLFPVRSDAAVEQRTGEKVDRVLVTIEGF